MTDAQRVRFKYKLGLHFARPTEEELAAEIYPPSLATTIVVSSNTNSDMSVEQIEKQ